MTYTDLIMLNAAGPETEFWNSGNMLQFIKGQIVPTVPEGQSLMSADILEFGKQRRATMAGTCPMVPETTEAMSKAMKTIGEKAKEYIAHMDF